MKDLAEWVNLDQEFPDLGPYASNLWGNITSLLGGNEEGVDGEAATTSEDGTSEAGAASTSSGEAQGASAAAVSEKDSDHYNPILSAITFRPNYEKLEELAAAAYNG